MLKLEYQIRQILAKSKNLLFKSIKFKWVGLGVKLIFFYIKLEPTQYGGEHVWFEFGQRDIGYIFFKKSKKI
jgi:hypothetical protein